MYINYHMPVDTQDMYILPYYSSMIFCFMRDQKILQSLSLA
jgi:hypothetical protein